MNVIMKEKEKLTWKTAPDLVNCGEAAELLGVSPHTIYRWRANKKFPSIKRGKAWLMEKEEIYKCSKEYALKLLKLQGTPITA